MKTDSFNAPEILDVTEVEKVKIQQEGETHRKALEEREATERVAITARRERWTSPEFLTMLGISLVVALVMSGSVGACYVSRRYPEQPDPCVEKRYVTRSLSDQSQSCPGGTHLEAKSLGEHDIEIICRCGK